MLTVFIWWDLVNVGMNLQYVKVLDILFYSRIQAVE